MEECKRMGLAVLGPDVNESYYKFAVNKEGAIRFGLGAHERRRRRCGAFDCSRAKKKTDFIIQCLDSQSV